MGTTKAVAPTLSSEPKAAYDSLTERMLAYVFICNGKYLYHACTSTIMERLDLRSPEEAGAIFESLNKKGLLNSTYVAELDVYNFTLTERGQAEAQSILTKAVKKLRGMPRSGPGADNIHRVLRTITDDHIWSVDHLRDLCLLAT